MSFHTTVIPDGDFYDHQTRFHDFLESPVWRPGRVLIAKLTFLLCFARRTMGRGTAIRSG
jgi:hypothetical protein